MGQNEGRPHAWRSGARKPSDLSPQTRNPKPTRRATPLVTPGDTSPTLPILQAPHATQVLLRALGHPKCSKWPKCAECPKFSKRRDTSVQSVLSSGPTSQVTAPAAQPWKFPSGRSVPSDQVDEASGAPKCSKCPKHPKRPLELTQKIRPKCPNSPSE